MDEHHMEQAEAFAQAERDRALAEVQAKLAAEKHPDFDGENCVQCGARMTENELLHNHYTCDACVGNMDCADCGTPVPAERQQMGRCYCVPCQERIDLRKKQYAR